MGRKIRFLPLILIALVLANCGFLWTNLSGVGAGGLSPAFFSDIFVASAGTTATVSGRPGQSHIFYVPSSGQWWILYLNSSAPNVLRSTHSSDLTTWTSGATVTLSNNLTDGTNFGVFYKNIAGVDVIHVALSYHVANNDFRHYHIRGTISGTTLTWGAESAQIDCSGAVGAAGITEDGGASVVGTDNKIHDIVGFFGPGCAGFEFGEQASDATNADLGSSWVGGFNAGQNLALNNGAGTSHSAVPLAAGKVLAMQSDAQGCATCEDMQNIFWATWNGAAWSAGGTDIFVSNFAPTIFSEDWGSVWVSNTNVSVVARTGANTFVWSQFDGVATWNVPGAAVPNQTSASNSGVFLASDGTNIWLFVLDSDAVNTIKYIKYNGITWGSWITLAATSTISKSHLSGYPMVINGHTIALIWTQTNGANFDLYVRAVYVN